jgi:hypothetical protein
MGIIRELIQAVRELTAEIRLLRQQINPVAQGGGGGGPAPVK